MAERDTYKYHLIKGRRIVHRGITNDLERRQREHQKTRPGSEIRQVGRKTTREAALKWERDVVDRHVSTRRTRDIPWARPIT